MRRPDAALLLVLLLGACKTAPVNEDPLPASVGGVDVEVLEQTFTDVILQITLDARSLPGTEATAAHLEVTVNQRSVASLELPAHGKVVQDGTLAVVLTTRVHLAANPEELSALGKRRELALLARGTLTLERDGLTRRATFAKVRNLPAPHELVLSVKQASAARYDHGELNLAFQLAVQNPNAFPVRLRGVRYGLALAGQAVGDDTLGQAELVAGASTALFDVPQFLDASYEELNARLIKLGSIPYELTGEVATEPYSRRFTLRGAVRLSDQR